MGHFLFVFLAAGVFSYALCPLVSRLALRLGIVSQPVQDRWHREPTPLLGGLAIGIGTLAAAGLLSTWDRSIWVLVGAGAAALVLGLLDDRVALGATAKLVGSLAIGAGVVYAWRATGPEAPSA